MNAEQFRKLALDLPESHEGAHMGHADFRVNGRVFASLGPDESWGMVKLTPETQHGLLVDHAKFARPASGAWGRGGCTIIELRLAKAAVVRSVLLAAWQNVASKKLRHAHGFE